jgi:hypothetical protein
MLWEIHTDAVLIPRLETRECPKLPQSTELNQHIKAFQKFSSRSKTMKTDWIYHACYTYTDDWHFSEQSIGITFGVFGILIVVQ